MSICTVEDTKKLRDAVIAGIAAPALITSVGAGVDRSQENAMLFNVELITSAYASENMVNFDPEKLYEYKIKSIPNDSNDWRQNSLNYDLVLENSVGEKEKVNLVGNSANSIEFNSNAPVKDVWVVDSKGKTISHTSINASSSGELLIQPYVESEKDFSGSWAQKVKPKLLMPKHNLYHKKLNY